MRSSQYLAGLAFLLICILPACQDNDGGDASPKRTDSLDKGWTPTDTNNSDEAGLIPDVQEPKPEADSALSSFLPSKLLDYLGDHETQNSDNKTPQGENMPSVVRVYRKNDKMIGINVSDFSKLTEVERTKLFEYQFKVFKVLKNKPKTVYKTLNIAPTIQGALLYSHSLNKSLIMLNVADHSIVTISSDTSISIQKFESLAKLIDYKKIDKLKYIS